MTTASNTTGPRPLAKRSRSVRLYEVTWTYREGDFEFGSPSYYRCAKKQLEAEIREAFRLESNNPSFRSTWTYDHQHATKAEPGIWSWTRYFEVTARELQSIEEIVTDLTLRRRRNTKRS